ncbi:hypothetical protein OROGR_013604 [Orobanche gracilis]
MEGGLGSSSAGPSTVNNNSNVEVLDLPPRFRFHLTDEEIIMHYLLKKVMNKRFSATAIAEADRNKCEPWDLPKKAQMGEKEWYFFQRDRKYPTGMRTNRATESGYWKATDNDKEICHKSRNNLIGMKKTLVFYKGRAPKGEKTNSVMHEYRLEGNLSNYNIYRATEEEFVVCRVFHKNTGVRKLPADLELARINSFVDHLFDRCDKSNLGLIASKTEHFSSNNSVISQLQDTGFSTENLGNDLTSLESEGNLASKKKPFDQELEGLGFSLDISDLDSLWSY